MISSITHMSIGQNIDILQFVYEDKPVKNHKVEFMLIHTKKSNPSN